jgi:hypothetical protein
LATGALPWFRARRWPAAGCPGRTLQDRRAVLSSGRSSVWLMACKRWGRGAPALGAG